MTADVRLAVVLVGSFLLWSPALSSLLQGDLDPGAAGVRFAGAVALTWMAARLLGHLVGGYQRAAEEGDGDAGHGAAHDHRRRSDEEPAAPGAPHAADVAGAGVDAPSPEEA